MTCGRVDFIQLWTANIPYLQLRATTAINAGGDRRRAKRQILHPETSLRPLARKHRRREEKQTTAAAEEVCFRADAEEACIPERVNETPQTSTLR